MRKSEVAEIVMMLLASYPTAKTVERTSELYETMLADLDFAVARKAVTRLIVTSKWLPTIAEIRESCTALVHGPLRAGGEAWRDAIGEVRRGGRYAQPRFADALVGETIRLWGSWQGFCDSPEDDPGGRARFIELYEQLAARRRADVVSGIALPAPKGEPRRLSRVPVEPQLASPTATFPLALPTLKARSVSVYAGRRLSAAEIDAALDASQEAAQ